MKHILFICLLFLCIACKEDRSVDPTIMPEPTTVGKNTFGCLIDDWVYTGGRWGIPTADFVQEEDSSFLVITAEVGFSSYIRLTLINPKQGETVTYRNASFDNLPLENGKAHISRMGKGIVSGTFESSRMTKGIASGTVDGPQMTKGRFDLKYKE